MQRKWSKDAIAFEILSMYESGENLNYGNVANTHIALLRAAVRNFGTWEQAVSFAGLDYSQIRRYKSWSKERIVARILELQATGVDLSWRNIITVDPQLSAAATKKIHFGSWREALEAAGLDYDCIRRYREWDDTRVLRMVREMHARGTGMNAKSVEQEDITLITAARRRFSSWPEALDAAGLNVRRIVLRAPFKRGRGPGQANGT
ncbi:MAG: hypothetical protein ACLQVD_11930 [Capsulimonadaceae bacterium]